MVNNDGEKFVAVVNISDKKYNDKDIVEWCNQSFGSQYSIQIGFESITDTAAWYYCLTFESEEDLIAFNLAWS